VSTQPKHNLRHAGRWDVDIVDRAAPLRPQVLSCGVARGGNSYGQAASSEEHFDGSGQFTIKEIS